MLSRFDQCGMFWVDITCVTSDSSKRPTCSVEAMDWKWRPPFSPGRLSPSTLFFAHVFPLKLSNTTCFTLGFVLCFAIVTSFPSPPQTRCFPPPQNCPLFFSGFCLSRVLHLIHLSVRSIITFSTIFDDYDQKKTYNFLKHITPVTSSDHYNFIR